MRDAQQVINAYQETFGRNSALMILTWALGTYLKPVSHYYPHMALSADKGIGKSRLIEKLEITTGIRKFSSNSLSESLLRDITADTSLPIAFDELYNFSREKTLLESAMKGHYSNSFRSPILVSGENLDMRNMLSITVCTSLRLNMRGPEIDIGAIPEWPIEQWLQFLKRINKRTLLIQTLGACREYCKSMVPAANRNSTSLKMVNNYALLLLSWKLLCEFAEINEAQRNYNYVVVTLISQINEHNCLIWEAEK